MLLHVNYVQSTCTECMSCYVMLCYIMVGFWAAPCPKNVSAQSDPVSFCASDNKRLVTCNPCLASNTPPLSLSPPGGQARKYMRNFEASHCPPLPSSEFH